MSAPPGFNPNATLLPDPGASSAPIHVMRGGGQKGGAWTEAQLKVLTEYSLAPGQSLADRVKDDVKTAFLEQLPLCDGVDASILDKKCWAVQQVVKAILNTNVAKSVAVAENGLSLETDSELEDIPKPKTTVNTVKAKIVGIAAAEAAKAPERAAKKAELNALLREAGTGNTAVNELVADINAAVAAEKAKKLTPISIPASSAAETEEPPSPNIPTPKEAVNTNTLENSEDFLQGVSTNYATATSESEKPPEVNTLADEAISADLAKQTQVENGPKNFRGNRSGKSAKFKTDLTRKAEQRYYADFIVDGKPVRIRGNSPDSILRRYNYESQERPKAFQRTLRTYGEHQESKKKQQHYDNLERAKQNAAERQKKESEQSLKNIAAREAKEEQKHLENVVKQQQENIKRQQNEQKLALAESQAKLKAASAAAKKAQAATKPGLGTRFKGLFKGGKSRRNRTLYRKTRKNRK